MTPLDLPLDLLTTITRERSLTGRDHLRVSTEYDEYRFRGVWAEWSEVLRRELTQGYGREIVEESPEVWRVVAGYGLDTSSTSAPTRAEFPAARP
jgi:hypothetical protein